MTGATLAKGDPDALHDVRGPVVVDPNDDEHPYKMFAWGQHLEHWDSDIADKQRLAKLQELTGYYYLESADGLRWSAPVKVKEGGDTFAYSWDPMKQRWLLADRGWSAPNRFGEFIRLIDMYESRDLQQFTYLSGATTLDEADGSGLHWQHWGMQPFVYGDQYLALLCINSSQSAHTRMVLASSRDGARWRLPLGDERFLPVGEPGRWNGESVNISLNPPIRHDDRLHVYYTARNSRIGGPADNYLGVASFAADRFAGMSCTDGGHVTTEPARIIKPYLDVNMHITWGGVKAAILDLSGRPLPGYTLDDAIESRERSVRARLQWKDKKDLRELIGRTVHLSFAIRHASLYSYRFSDA